jgi:predicted ATP-grasp superfamily ATP-dependent carboligase
MAMSEKPIAVLYEHPRWFEPLFAELDRRQVAYERLHVGDHLYDPSQRECPYSLVVNRVSACPSDGHRPSIVLYVQQYLAHLESIGAQVINGYRSYLVGASKAMQLDLLERLGVRYPRTRVIHHPDQAVLAAAGLTFPILLKPNIGGSGAGILKFETVEELALAVDMGTIDLGIDHVGLVQEYLPAQGDHICRVEILDGQILYGIRLPMSNDSFNYCPADGCNIDNPELAVEAFSPPTEFIEDVRQILAAASVDVGSVEYLVSARDGQAYYYDINPLSNFVTSADHVLGFDPVISFVDYILERASAGGE